MDLTLPADTNAEKAVLGSCLIEPDAILAIAWLKPDAFYLRKHELIFSAMLACAESGEPPDIALVHGKLRSRGHGEETGGLLYLGELAAEVPTPYYVEYYARHVEEASVRRRLIQAAGQIQALAYDESGNLDATISEADGLLERACESSASDRYAPIPLEVLLRKQFPPTRFIIPGLISEGLTLLGGKPKMKKSWMALGFGIAVASGGKALGAIPVEQGEVLYLCLEDRDRRLQSRAEKLLQGGVIPNETFYFQTLWPRLNEGGLVRLERWMETHPKTRLIIVDTLKKVKARTSKGNGRMYDDDYESIEPLQMLATRYPVGVLVVHHFNQKAEAADPLDFFTGSSGLTGAIDNGLGILHDRMTGEGTLFAIGRDFEEDRELSIKWDAQTAQWLYQGECKDVKLSSERQAVLDVLDDSGALHYKDIADATQQKPVNCKQLCKRMTDEGLLERVSAGIYRVAINDQRGLDEIPSHSGDLVIGGDPRPITAFQGNRTPEKDPGDPVIRKVNFSESDEKVPIHDHRITSPDFSRSDAPNTGDRPRITTDHQITGGSPAIFFEDIPNESELRRAGYRFLGIRDWIAYGPGNLEIARVSQQTPDARNEVVRLAWIHYRESQEG